MNHQSTTRTARKENEHQRAARVAVKFLQRWNREGPHVLSAIHPDQGFIQTHGFGPEDGEEMLAWIEQWFGRRNVYFQYNTDLRSVADIDTKGRKEHIGSVVALAADIDQYKGDGNRDRVIRYLTQELPPGIPGPPTVINNSGNGVNAYWRLREPIVIDGNLERAAEIERHGRGLAVAFNGDATFDVNRILRLPGTLNLPNENKRALGLKPVWAKPMIFEPSRLYALDQFPRVDIPAALRGSGRARNAEQRTIGDGYTIDDLNDLPVSDRTKTIIELGSLPGVDKEAGRSGWLFSALLSLIRARVPDEEILGIVTDGAWSISESVLEKPDPDHYARRQIVRAHALIEAEMRELFDDFEIDEEDTLSITNSTEEHTEDLLFEDEDDD